MSEKETNGTAADSRPVDALVGQVSELDMLRDRVKRCATADEAEKMALIRAIQEIAQAVGLSPLDASPRQVVEAVQAIANSWISRLIRWCSRERYTSAELVAKALEAGGVRLPPPQEPVTQASLARKLNTPNGSHHRTE